MANISKEQIKRLYALGSALGIVESGNREDGIHVLVYGLTQKDSIRALTVEEFRAVERELLTRMQLKHRTAPLKRRPKPEPKGAAAPGMMSAEQQGLAWRMIYRLMELDPDSVATAGERMIGAIKKVLGMTVTAAAPFRWVTAEQGQKLVEQLKRYVRSAERQAKKAGAG